MVTFLKAYRPRIVHFNSAGKADVSQLGNDSAALIREAARFAEPLANENLNDRLDRLCRQYRELCAKYGIDIETRTSDAPAPVTGDRGATSDNYFGVRRTQEHGTVLARGVIAAMAQMLPFAASDVRGGKLSPTEFELMLALVNAIEIILTA